MSTTMYRGKNN